MRKWNASFSGDRGQSIEAFLVKIEACRGSTSLSDEEVFEALPELLKGVGYGTGRGYQQRLLAEATARTQVKDELARDFVTCLLIIIRKMEPVPNRPMQLDMLHRNLRPELQKLVRRADFRDIDELQEMARKAEVTLEAERLFRPPPPPDLTIVPEAAYKSRSENPVKPKLSGVEPARHESPTGTETSADQSILVTISRLEAGLNELKAKQNSRPPGNNSKRKKNDYRQERRKPPPAKPRQKEEREGQSRTGNGNKTAKDGKTGHKSNGIPEPIKCWGCDRIRYRRSFCPEC